MSVILNGREYTDADFLGYGYVSRFPTQIFRDMLATLGVTGGAGGLTFLGQWNAATNTPTLPTPSEINRGWFYQVNVAGDYNGTHYNIGDAIGCNAIDWIKLLAGPKGDAATITLGTITTGAPGSNVIITNSGTQYAAVLNITIPAGDKGDRGLPGDATVYSAAVTYAINNQAYSGSDIYYSLQNNNLNHDPASSPTWWAKVNLGGGGDMYKADNLSGLADVAAARTSLGLGNSATRDIGAGSTQVATGNHNHDLAYEAKNSNIQSHISSATIHVTSLEKSAWNKLISKARTWDLKVDFGAIGDGVTDDLPALVLANTTISDGDIIDVPPGRYRKTNEFHFTKRVWLRGNGFSYQVGTVAITDAAYKHITDISDANGPIFFNDYTTATAASGFKLTESRSRISGIGFFDNQPDPTGTVVTGTNIAAVSDGFTSGSNAFGTYTVGMAIRVAGFANSGINATGGFKVTAVTSNKLTVTPPPYATEAAGASVTVTGWKPNTNNPVPILATVRDSTIGGGNSGAFIEVDDICFFNTTYGLKGNGPSAIQIGRVFGQTFSPMVDLKYIYHCINIGHIEVWPFWANLTGPRAYMETDSCALKTGRVDGGVVDKLFTIGCSKTWHNYYSNCQTDPEFPFNSIYKVIGCSGAARTLYINSMFIDHTCKDIFFEGVNDTAAGTPNLYSTCIVDRLYGFTSDDSARGACVHFDANTQGATLRVNSGFNYWANDFEVFNIEGSGNYLFVSDWESAGWDNRGSGAAMVNIAAGSSVYFNDVRWPRFNAASKTLKSGAGTLIEIGENVGSTSANGGTGYGELFRASTAADGEAGVFHAKRIRAGNNVTVTNGTDDITISSSGGGTGTPSGTVIGAIQLRNSDGTGFDADDQLYCNKTGNYVGFTRSNAPASLFAIVLGTNDINQQASIESVVYDGSYASHLSTQNIANFALSKYFYNSGGTVIGAPSGYYLGEIFSKSRDSSGAASTGSRIRFRTAADWTSGNHSSAIEFWNGYSGDTAYIPRLDATIDDNGLKIERGVLKFPDNSTQSTAVAVPRYTYIAGATTLTIERMNVIPSAGTYNIPSLVGNNGKLIAVQNLYTSAVSIGKTDGYFEIGGSNYNSYSIPVGDSIVFQIDETNMLLRRFNYQNTASSSWSNSGNNYTTGKLAVGAASGTADLEIKSAQTTGTTTYAVQVIDKEGVTRFQQRTDGIGIWTMGTSGQLMFSTPGGGIGMGFNGTSTGSPNGHANVTLANYLSFAGFHYQHLGGLFLNPVTGNAAINNNYSTATLVHRFEINSIAFDKVYLNSTDNTTEAQTTGGTPFNVLTNNTDYFYIGSAYSGFAQAYFKLAQNGVGLTLSAEYWNGTVWAALTITDGTSNLSQSGLITWAAPSTWATTSVNSVSKYWVRFKTTAVTTAPTAYLVVPSYEDLLAIYAQKGDATPMFHISQQGFVSNPIGSAVASASTITPTGPIFHVTGTTQINTISVPFTGFTGGITIIPDGIFTTGTSGNIALGSTAVVGRVLTMTYDGSKWYPSY